MLVLKHLTYEVFLYEILDKLLICLREVNLAPLIIRSSLRHLYQNDVLDKVYKEPYVIKIFGLQYIILQNIARSGFKRIATG